jgi:hypothetical protein
MRMIDRTKTTMLSRLLIALLIAAAVVSSAEAGEIPCARLEARVANVERILAGDWLQMQPADVRKAWYRPLEHVDTACEIQGECYFLGNATNLATSKTEPSAGDCAESFVFQIERKERRLGSVSMRQWFASVPEALHAASLMSNAVHPPSDACASLHAPWHSLERGRDCSWSTGEGDRVIDVTIRLVHVGSVWAAELGVSRMSF